MRAVRVYAHRRRVSDGDPRPQDPDTRRKNEWYRRKRLQLIKEFGGACQTCNALENLEFAHAVATGLGGMGRGRNARILDVIRHPEAYRLLCRECHVRRDATVGIT